MKVKANKFLDFIFYTLVYSIVFYTIVIFYEKIVFIIHFKETYLTLDLIIFIIILIIIYLLIKNFIATLILILILLLFLYLKFYNIFCYVLLTGVIYSINKVYYK